MASYTGGTATSGTTTRPYTYDYPGGIYVYGGGLSASAGSGDTASCTGGITATFTWLSSTLLPPSVVIIEQSTEAWARGSTVNDVYTPPASCSVNNPYSSPGSSSSPGTLLGKQYSAKSDPGASFSVTCSGLSSSATPQASSDGSFVFASVSYAAAAFPVTINPGGAKSDGSGGWDILVGQECTVSLAGIPSDCDVSNYQWSVSGTTFQSWSGSTSASAYVDGTGPTTNPTAHWYWNEISKTLETITCTATVKPPIGQGSSFPITVTQQVTVLRPNWTCTGFGGTLQVSPDPHLSSVLALWAAPIAGSETNTGMTWRATVSPPTGTTFGAGSLAIAQIITPGESYISYSSSPAPQIYPAAPATDVYLLNDVGMISRPTTTHKPSDYGQPGLDAFPYGWSLGTGTASSPNLGGDAPGFALDPAMLSATLADTFVDYLMYEPPGSSQWVPLATFNWSTNGSPSQPTGGWDAFGSGSAGSVTPSGSNVMFSPSNTFPMWTRSDPVMPFQ